jgi:CheY-like chemotaxis protein
MVYGMVERHNGELEIESAPGKGTTIRLTFPVSANVKVETPAATRKSMVAPPQRILVIDDDPLVLNSICETLTSDGHVVVASTGGNEGIEAFRSAIEHNESFNIVITDLGMPFVDGRRVAASVKDLSPTTPVILFTGWGQRLVADDEIPPHVDLVLSKPPKLHDLREALVRLSV